MNVFLIALVAMLIVLRAAVVQRRAAFVRSYTIHKIRN